MSLAGLAIVGPASMLTASWGARAAHSLSRRGLSIAFGEFLMIVAARMIWRAIV